MRLDYVLGSGSIVDSCTDAAAQVLSGGKHASGPLALPCSTLRAHHPIAPTMATTPRTRRPIHRTVALHHDRKAPHTPPYDHNRVLGPNTHPITIIGY